MDNQERIGAHYRASFNARLGDPAHVLFVLKEAGWTYETLTQAICDGRVAVPVEQAPLPPESP
jgi:hypothetical protein